MSELEFLELIGVSINSPEIIKKLALKFWEGNYWLGEDTEKQVLKNTWFAYVVFKGNLNDIEI